MVERESPLGAILRPGTYGKLSSGPGVRLSEATPQSILEAAAWPGKKETMAAAIASVTGLSLSARPNAGAMTANSSAFSIGPDRFLVTGGEELASRLAAAITLDIGTVVDLSHGRAAIRIAGLKAEWVLSKLFAIDFSLTEFPVSEGRATAHHVILAQIHRVDTEKFDIFVFRSFTRAFWGILCDAAEDVGWDAIGNDLRT